MSSERELADAQRAWQSAQTATGRQAAAARIRAVMAVEGATQACVVDVRQPDGGGCVSVIWGVDGEALR